MFVNVLTFICYKHIMNNGLCKFHALKFFFFPSRKVEGIPCFGRFGNFYNVYKFWKCLKRIYTISIKLSEHICLKRQINLLRWVLTFMHKTIDHLNRVIVVELYLLYHNMTTFPGVPSLHQAWNITSNILWKDAIEIK